MKKILACSVLFPMACLAQYQYPETRTEIVSDMYFGTKIDDPYRWLENVKDENVVQWLKAQDDFAENAIAKFPNQDKLIAEMREYDKIGADKIWPIAKGGNKYFYRKKIKGEQLYKIFYREGLDGKETLLFDPSNYIEGKIMDFNAEVSSDGSRVILNLSEAGSENGDIRIMDVKTGKLLPDMIPHSEGYFMDGTNDRIFYLELKSYDVHDPEVRLNRPVKSHKIGTPVSSDVVMASSKKNPELGMTAAESPNLFNFANSPYIFLAKMTVDNFLQLYYAPISELDKDKINWKVLSKREDEVWNFYADGHDIYVYTSKNNPNFRILKSSLKNLDFSKAKEILAGTEEWKLEEVSQAKDYLIVSKSKNGVIFDPWAYNLRTGQMAKIDAPVKGNAEASAVSRQSNEVKIINSEWNIPLDYYHFDLDKKQFGKGPFHAGSSVPGIGNIVYEEIEVPSHDGVLVPLSLVYDKTKMRKDGSNIGFLNGYGAYGRTAYLPTFSANMLPLLNRGVVLAIAHVRGGGEKGKSWYLAGKKTTKPNTWKDANACAEYLIKNNFTSASRLGITGASAGGILVGRAITERPDLYRAAIPKVGCLNALRMEFSPNGPGNIPEFGTVTLEDEFKALLEMDAFQHVQKGTKYPAQLITTGFNDSRVDSYIPAKFAAMMQAKNGSGFPILLDVDYKAGHFGGSTADEKFIQSAREYAFLLGMCGHPDFQAKP